MGGGVAGGAGVALARERVLQPLRLGRAHPDRSGAVDSRLVLARLEAYGSLMSAATETIALEIPRDLPQVTKMTPTELKQELAFALFAQDKISFGKARELAGLTVWQFQNELGRRGISIHYDTAELAEDVATLHALRRP
jgi:predicted HTH domain antitoxin